MHTNTDATIARAVGLVHESSFGVNIIGYRMQCRRSGHYM